jgi:hypothetical protein
MDSPETSPTGTPILPVRWNLALALVFGVAGASLAVLQTEYPMIHGFEVAWKLCVAIGSALGIASAGARALPLLALLFVLPLASCSHVSPQLKADLVSCGEAAVSDQVGQLLPRVAAALNGSDEAWAGELDQVVLDVGGAAICAVKALVAELGRLGGSGPLTIIPAEGQQSTRLLEQRGKAWLLTRGIPKD